jgi:hypothetical protein
MASNKIFLQRGANAAVWGWATPNTAVIIELEGAAIYVSNTNGGICFWLR